MQWLVRPRTFDIQPQADLRFVPPALARNRLPSGWEATQQQRDSLETPALWTLITNSELSSRPD